MKILIVLKSLRNKFRLVRQVWIVGVLDEDMVLSGVCTRVGNFIIRTVSSDDRKVMRLFPVMYMNAKNRLKRKFSIQ